MKAWLGIITSIVLLVLLAAGTAVAQSLKPSADLDDVRSKIKRLEGMDIRKMAPSTLEIYQRTLLRLYEQCSPALQQQIDLLATIQTSAGDSSTAAAEARAKLAEEMAQITDKISILRMSLGEPDDSSATTNLNARSTLPADDTEATPSGAASSLAHAPEPSAPPAPVPSTPAATQPVVSALPATVVSVATPPASASPDSLRATAAQVDTCAYPNVPPVLKDATQRLAGSILFNDGTPKEKAQEIGSENYKLVFYTIADALQVQVTAPLPRDPAARTVSLSELEPYQYLGETLRTDKQLGSASSSAASVSSVDKPGFAWLLGLGIDNGLVEQDVRDTVLTLSTSPAALYMLNKGNSNPYQSAGFLNRIGVSASFNISNQDQLLSNVSRSQLAGYSIKYRFAGDRSPRSKKLEALWDSVAQDIQQRLVALNDASQFISRDSVLGPLATRTNLELQVEVVSLLSSDDFKRLAAADGSVTQPQIDMLSNTILCYLSRNVLNQRSNLSAGAIKQFNEVLVPNLVSAQLNLKVVRDVFNERVDEFFKGALGTFAYFNNRDPLMGNYSEFKVLYDHPMPMLAPIGMEKLTANAGYSFYHRPNLAINQKRTRDFSAALSFEGSKASPFTETVDLGRITYSFVGRYERMIENRNLQGRKADLASLQFLLDIPLFKGMAFPFSLTYANATATDKRSGWHANFSLKLDTDKLLEIVRATAER